MKRLNNSNFELLQDVIKDLNLSYNTENCKNIENIQKIWIDTIGNKISKFAKVYDFSNDNILTVVCSDSFVSNELYFEKEKLFRNMNEKLQKLGIKIKDIKFDYKKWKESNNE